MLWSGVEVGGLQWCRSRIDRGERWRRIETELRGRQRRGWREARAAEGAGGGARWYGRWRTVLCPDTHWEDMVGDLEVGKPDMIGRSEANPRQIKLTRRV
jgi:hypothetical protein